MEHSTQIYGERVVLRPYATGDAAALYQLVESNRGRLIQSFPITVSSCGTLHDTSMYIIKLQSEKDIGSMLSYGIYLKEENNLIGHIFAKSIEWKIPKCEVGYYIDKNYEGKGYITEALNTLVEYCFSHLNMQKIFIRIIPGNAGSRRVAEKAGFVLEGLLRKEFRTHDNELVDVEYFGKTHE